MCRERNDVGLGLEYTQGAETKMKMIDLLDLDIRSDVEAAASVLAAQEPLLTGGVRPQLVRSLRALQRRLREAANTRYLRHRTLRAHILPLTNATFSRAGDRCLTGSYDRTCKLWDVHAGGELRTFEGHRNVVKHVLTGSFDKTARVWNAQTGECLQTLWGHSAEVVSAKFDPTNQLVATASMDNTARLYNTVSGQELGTLRGHTGEVVVLHFNSAGDTLLTGSFDGTLALWDTRTNHLVASCSLDRTARVWDPRQMKSLATITGHEEEDVSFDYSGRRLATCSTDCTARVWDVAENFDLVALMEGHRDEICKVPSSSPRVCFSPGGSQLLTASQDRTARLWTVETGTCVQVLEGHRDDLFFCSFSYNGDVLLTASKDNTCRVWQRDDHQGGLLRLAIDNEDLAGDQDVLDDNVGD
ncbi:hypothetical protein FOCC_FOCC003339 [Frankliniella occidentalis]|nr:hypothetical protein FOCC_FOCC003339 [Frankliniella occidentalis]